MLSIEVVQGSDHGFQRGHSPRWSLRRRLLLQTDTRCRWDSWRLECLSRRGWRRVGSHYWSDANRNFSGLRRKKRRQKLERDQPSSRCDCFHSWNLSRDFRPRWHLYSQDKEVSMHVRVWHFCPDLDFDLWLRFLRPPFDILRHGRATDRFL